MRIFRRLLALAVPAVVVLIGAPAATAGGPTSVIIVNSDEDTTASLYNSEPDYQTLLDALEPRSDGGPPQDLGAPSPANVITVNWLIHDVSTWRIDRIKVVDDDLWVHTTDSLSGDVSELWQSVPDEWRRPQDPQALAGVLDRLGVLDPSAAPQQTARETARDEAIAAEPADNAGIGANWWWTLPGVALGLALGALGRPRIGAWIRQRERGPRQQLIDT